MKDDKDKRVIKGENTKNKILKASIALFSKKGYDATSISEISKKAKVTKSLLYHHYKNKDDILKHIMSHYLTQVQEIIDYEMEKHEIKNLDSFFISLKSSTHNFLSENRMIVKILLSESFKNKEFSFHLFRIFEDFKNYIYTKIGEEEAMKIHNKLNCRVEEFYFHFIPTIIFSAFNDLWCEYFKISSDETRNIFFSILENMEGCELCNI